MIVLYPTPNFSGEVIYSQATTELAADYIDIFLPPNCSVIALGQYGEYLVENIWEGTQQPAAPVTTGLSPTAAISYLNGTGGGIFRISATNDRPISIGYETNYDHWSYAYFDDKGQAVGSVAPEGIDLGSTAFPDFTTQSTYNSLGWLLWEEI